MSVVKCVGNDEHRRRRVQHISDEQFHNFICNTPKHELKYHTKHVPASDQDNEYADYRCTNVPIILVRLCNSLRSVSSQLCLTRLTCAQALHHAPASPPPPGADAAAWHLPQYAPTSPIISMSEMLQWKISRLVG